MTDLARIIRLLDAHDGGGSLYRIAKLIGVECSTALRWHHEEAAPTPAHQQAMRWLRRTLEEADQGNPDAVRMRKAFLASPGLVGTGERGVLIAAGLGWLVAPEPVAP